MEATTDDRTDPGADVRRRRKGEAGFTLVEVLIVLAILAVLVAIVLPNFTGLLGGAQAGSAEAELNILQTAVDVKMADQSLTAITPVTVATSDMTAGGFDLAPTYIRGTTTTGTYTVAADGTVTQVTTGY